MTTSGVTTTELNRDSIISAAMRKCQVLAKGQTPDAEDLSNGTSALNNLVAQLMTMGMPLWAENSYTVPLVAGQASYTIGVGQSVNTPFPLRVIQAWYIPSGGTSRQDIFPTANYDMNKLPDGSSGTPSQYSYQPKINYGILTIWPKPDTTATAGAFTIRYVSPFETFSGATDTPYFPREWNNALIYGLAALLAPEYGVPLQDRAQLEKQAQMHLDIALDSGDEPTSIYLSPADQ